MSDKHITDKFVSVDRYYISGLHPHIWKHPEGEMVYFDDYVNLWVEKERLKAEVERLQHLANQSEFYRSQLQKDTSRLENIQMQDAFKHYEAENARLKAEVERLRKAGDAMVELLCHMDVVMDMDSDHPEVEAWNAAKEGRPNE